MGRGVITFRIKSIKHLVWTWVYTMIIAVLLYFMFRSGVILMATTISTLLIAFLVNREMLYRDYDNMRNISEELEELQNMLDELNKSIEENDK